PRPAAGLARRRRRDRAARAARRRPAHRRHPRPQLRPVDPRRRPRGRHGLRRPVQGPGGREAARRGRRGVRGEHRRPDRVRPVRAARGARLRPGREDPAVDAGAPVPGGDAPGLAGRRRHQLPDAGARPAAARVRPGQAHRPEPGERLGTLDHVKRARDREDILSTDESGPVSMAGTMGGLATEIDDRSTDMVIEAAHFDAVGTARMSRRHRLHSEASYRFERGVDRELPLYASYRAVQMLAELGGAEILPGVTHAETPVEPVTVTIPADHPDKVAGVTYGRDTVVRRLEQVGCKVEGDQTLTVTPPSW